MIISKIVLTAFVTIGVFVWLLIMASADRGDRDFKPVRMLGRFSLFVYLLTIIIIWSV